MWNISAHPYQNIKRAPTTALFSPLRPFSYSLTLSLFLSTAHMFSLQIFPAVASCLPPFVYLSHLSLCLRLKGDG